MNWLKWSAVTPFLLTETVEGPSEEQLIRDIFDKYNKYSRPVAKEDDALEVNFGVSLQQIIDVVREGVDIPTAYAV